VVLVPELADDWAAGDQSGRRVDANGPPHDARAHDVPGAEAKKVLARAPYGRTPLRYLYATGWLDGMKNQASCLFARTTPATTAAQVTKAIRGNRTLRDRLARMQVTAAQAASAIVRGTASAC